MARFSLVLACRLRAVEKDITDVTARTEVAAGTGVTAGIASGRRFAQLPVELCDVLCRKDGVHRTAGESNQGRRRMALAASREDRARPSCLIDPRFTG